MAAHVPLQLPPVKLHICQLCFKASWLPIIFWSLTCLCMFHGGSAKAFVLIIWSHGCLPKSDWRGPSHHRWSRRHTTGLKRCWPYWKPMVGPRKWQFSQRISFIPPCKQRRVHAEFPWCVVQRPSHAVCWLAEETSPCLPWNCPKTQPRELTKSRRTLKWWRMPMAISMSHVFCFFFASNLTYYSGFLSLSGSHMCFHDKYIVKDSIHHQSILAKASWLPMLVTSHA